ncbi:MAG: polyApolymerase family protein [Candidatus Midichloriaceae bacterium]|jgi:poly(A) polymerase|nr:polyApolymerase family protein [Candidatus Midichloriaceae bacterium]
MVNLEKFLPISELSELFAALAEDGESRLVGGAVREILLGHKPKDVDIATQVLPEKAMQLLTQKGYKCIPTGIKYGTITAVKNSHVFEVTTLRADVKTDGRHAEVIFGRNWELDASRRDFTWNAIYMDLQGNIFDHFDGVVDLKNLLLKFIGDPESRIKEDYLRILRYFRFYSYYPNILIDEPSVSACKKLASGVKNLSGERVRSELFKILSSPYATDALILMQKQEVLIHLLPGCAQIDFTTITFSENAVINLAAILKLSGLKEDVVDNIIKGLKLSNKEKAQINNLLWCIKLSPQDSKIKHNEILYHFGADAYSDYIKFVKALYPNQDIYHLEGNNAPKMPVTGTDLVNLGFAGKPLGDKMRELENIWIEADFKLSKKDLLARVMG